MQTIDLTQVPVIDNHCHGVLREQTFDDLAIWRQSFTESTDPGMARDHVASTAFYRRLIRTLADFLGCEPEEGAVFAARTGRDGQELTGALLRAANVDTLLLDTGFPPSEEVFPVPELGKLGGCRTEPMLRLEILMESLLVEHDSLEDVKEALAAELDDVRGQEYVALKSIAAYRTGLTFGSGPARRPKNRSTNTGGPPERALRASSTSRSWTRFCTLLLFRPPGRKFLFSSTSATPTQICCSAILSICVRCLSGRTIMACSSCCCTSATRTPGRAVTWPPSTSTSTLTSPTASPCSATARCSPSPGRRSESPRAPSSCIAQTA